MWNDEDNNPYGSFQRRDSNTSDTEQAISPASRFRRPSTPTSGQSSPHNEPADFARPKDLSDTEEVHDAGGAPTQRKQGGYDSRVEQMLYENADFQITITHAGKNSEGGGSYIAYTIRTGDLEVRRRYSDFYSLRQTLVNLHPTLIIPPIPEKHSVADYAAKPTKAKEDESIIEHRKRMLASFLNRCRKLSEVREDGVFWRFLDPHASWNEVLHSHPVSSLPKNILKAPPLDPANPTPGHNFLPIPSSTAKLKSAKDSKQAPSGTPTAPPPSASYPSVAAHTIPGQQVFGRFPPTSQDLSEQELDPYFVNFEASSRDLETLLQGTMEKVNRRTLSHLGVFAEDMGDLGGKFNGFSLSEQSQSLATAIEKIGQAIDNTYVATIDLSKSLSASFSEPMRESAQFAGIVRNVLQYRILKRVQEEMTRDELEAKVTRLNQLEKSEAEAQRIEQHIQNSGFAPSSPPRRSTSSASGRHSQDKQRSEEDTASIDSDFPPNRGDGSPPSSAQGGPQQRYEPASPTSTPKKNGGGNFITNKVFGSLNHAIKGMVDVDPERTRRDQIGRTKESLVQLEQALEVSEKDVKDASAGVLKSLKRFQGEKEDDLKRYMVAYARCHIDWAKRNLASWEEAKSEVEKIDMKTLSGLSVVGQLAFTTSSSAKKRKLTTFGRRLSSSSFCDDNVRSVFASDDSGLGSPRSSPSAAGPKTTSSASPRFLPQHLHDEVRDASAEAEYRLRKNTSHGYTTAPSHIGVAPSVQTDTRQRSMPPNSLEDQHGLAQHAGSASSLPFPEANMGRLGVGARASSPAKRSASEREEDDEGASQDMDVDMGNQPRSPKKTYQEYVSPMPNRFKPVNEFPRMKRATSSDVVDQDDTTQPSQSGSGSEASGSSRADADMSNSSASSVSLTAGTSVSGKPGGSAANIPSFDEQDALIRQLASKAPDEEGTKGYVISSKWLVRVQSRTSQGQHESHAKEAREGEVGPVDNSDIAMNDHFYGDLKDSTGNTFIPLNLGLQISEDFEVLPPPAWERIMQWYGVAESSHVIVRYLRNTSPSGAATKNLQYELYPPIFTIQKLLAEGDETSTSTVRENDVDAVSVVASRADGFQAFLKRIKSAAQIEMTTKVRVWKLVDAQTAQNGRSGMLTPSSSRGNSPAPPSSFAKMTPKLVVDLNAFSLLAEGRQRELIDIKDETANEIYNGRFNLGSVGCSEQQSLILEEQVRGNTEDYISDKLKKAAAQNGVNVTAQETNSSESPAKSKSTINNARRSPTPSGMMTRGRTNKKGKTRGCTGLTNLGNTCYMNSALQCIRSVEELSIYFLEQKDKGEINANNPLGYGGQMAKAYEGFLAQVYDPSCPGSFAPRNFKGTLGRCQPLFSGYGQQDSQEFLSFLVDGLHEDLNRVLKKPYRENPDSDDSMVHDPDAIKQLGEKYRDNHRARNDSVAMDLFSGFYKNTMVCPVCDKISITFDPFSLLTLQLPIESTFQHEVIFSSLNGRPVTINIDIDKNSNIRMLKDYIARRCPGSKAENMILAEMYGKKLYKVFEDTEVLSEAGIQQNDKLNMYELDATPSNWPPRDKKKAKNRSNEDDSRDPESNLSNRLAIPLIHRIQDNGGSTFVLDPSMILITRSESKSLESVFRKVLSRVSTLTTTNLIPGDGQIKSGDDRVVSDDTVTMNIEDTSSEDPSVQARSVEGEDGLVNISMNQSHGMSASRETIVDATPELPSRSSPFLDPGYFIDPAYRNMFTMHYFSSKDDVIPCGFNSVNHTDRFPALDSRVPPPPPSRRQSTSSWTSRGHGDSPATSDDELSRDASSNDSLGVLNNSPPSDSEEDKPPTNRLLPGGFRNRLRKGQLKKSGILKTYGRKDNKQPNVEAAPPNEFLIRFGEGIVLNWNRQAFDQLFGAKQEDDSRGSFTGEDPPVLPDPELDAKKARRAARKKSGVTLEECFEETSKSEVLSEENAWYCGRCKELRRATKTLELWTVPDILVVHLKRFSSSSRLRDKVDVLVDAPVEGLDLTGKVGLPEDKALQYDLFAVDNHYGGLGGGHYTAYAQNFFDKKWYEYNDSMVHQTYPQHVVTKAAYLLFYRRRSNKPLGPPYLQQIVSNAYAGSDTPQQSGEDQRLDGSSSPNGSSGSSLEATAGANPHEEGQPLLGFPTGGQRDLESTARSALTTNDRPPAYGTNNEIYDEGIGGMESDPDDPIPGYEDRQQQQQEQQRSVQDRFDKPSWSFDRVGRVAPPGSDNMGGSDDTLNGSNAPEQGDDLQERLRDFGDEDGDGPFRGTPMMEDEDLYGGGDEYDGNGAVVKHVEFTQHEEMQDDADAVVELRLSDEEGA